jgi:hypothetical protein
MLSVVMLNVVILSVVKLSVVAPIFEMLPFLKQRVQASSSPGKWPHCL